MSDTGLSQTETDQIKQVFANYPEVEKVMLYGSRAMGTYKPASDIDLTVIGDKINLTLLQAIESELDDLLLPYKIDLSEFHKITNPDLIGHINRVGKEFYKRKI